MGLAAAESTSERAPLPYRTGEPNVVVVVLDDTGFAQLGCSCAIKRLPDPARTRDHTR